LLSLFLWCGGFATRYVTNFQILHAYFSFR
jgi:hypothetical protein